MKLLKKPTMNIISFYELNQLIPANARSIICTKGFLYR